MQRDHASCPENVEAGSTEEDRVESWGVVTHLIYRFCPHRHQSREYSRCQENLVVNDVHSEDESTLPNLLKNARKVGHHGLDDATKEFEKDPLIGEFLMVDGVKWWIVASANRDGTYDIHHDAENLSCAFVPREVVEAGIYQQREHEKSKCALARAILPAWAIHPDANSSMVRSVGPSIPLARATAMGMLITQLVLLLVALASSACSANRPAAYPGSIIPAMLPVDVVRAIVEWRILKPALINFAQGTRFHILGIIEAPFVVWLMYVFGLSQLSFSDIGTDSLFTGSALRSIACDAMLGNVWNRVWQMSMLNWVWRPSLSAMIAMAWLLSTVQMVWPLLWSIRRSDLQCATPHGAGSYGMSPSVMSLLGSKETANLLHSDVLCALADAGGLASLQSMNIPRYANAHREAQADIHCSSIRSLLQGTKVLADIIVERMFLSYILENCIQVNLQATMYAVSIATWRLRGAEEEFQACTIFSIVIGIVASFLKLAEAYSFNKVVQSSSALAARFDSDEQIQSVNRDIQRRGWLARLAAFILVLGICCASAKIVMAHVCKDAVWNLNGCVSLHP